MIPPQTRHYQATRATLRPWNLALVAALWVFVIPLAICLPGATATSAAVRVNLGGDLQERRQEALPPGVERHSRVDRESAKGFGSLSRQCFGPCSFVAASHATADAQLAVACSGAASIPDNRDRYLRLAVLLI